MGTRLYDRYILVQFVSIQILMNVQRGPITASHHGDAALTPQEALSVTAWMAFVQCQLPVESSVWVSTGS